MPRIKLPVFFPSLTMQCLLAAMLVVGQSACSPRNPTAPKALENEAMQAQYELVKRYLTRNLKQAVL